MGTPDVRGLAWLIGGALLLGGCACPRPDGPPPPEPELQSRHAERAAALDRIFARANVRVTYTTERGGRETVQTEGRLNYIQPDRLALSIGPDLGEVMFYLGCDEHRHWWLDLRESRIALVGEHDAAGAGVRFDTDTGEIELRPRELFDLLGVSPMLYESQAAWSEDWCEIVADVMTPSGPARVHLDRRTREPKRIELLDDDGGVRAWSELGRYQGVVLRRGTTSVRFPGRADLHYAGSDTLIHLGLYVPENRQEKASDKPYDLDLLLDAYRVQEVRPFGGGGT